MCRRPAPEMMPAVVLMGVGSLFGTDWEKRQVERYLQEHGGVNQDA